jgi:ferritin heavy chain
MKLMEYQTKRGGKVVFQDIAKPSSTEWGTPIQAMEAALELEKTVCLYKFVG